MENKLRAAKDLNDHEYKYFLNIHAAHQKSMGFGNRKNYSLENVVKVERNFEENCFNVHYKNGDWWHYTLSGSWY